MMNFILLGYGSVTACAVRESTHHRTMERWNKMKAYSSEPFTNFILSSWEAWWSLNTRLLHSMPAFQNLFQPINPGWVFAGVVNVTGANSSAPDTEREIVAAHSYGRQLGRVIDAVEILINLQPKGIQEETPEFQELKKLDEDIERIKLKSAAKRINSVVADLRTLKSEMSPAEFENATLSIRETLLLTKR